MEGRNLTELHSIDKELREVLITWKEKTIFSRDESLMLIQYEVVNPQTIYIHAVLKHMKDKSDEIINTFNLSTH